MKWFLSFSLILLSSVIAAALSEAGDKSAPLTVSAGEEITIEYTLKLEDQTTVDSNVGDEPFKFIQGDHRIVPGLETALEGLKVGDKKQIKVTPEEGYGAVDPNAYQEIDKARLSPEAMVIGTLIEGRDPSGNPIRARVYEIKNSTVVLDLNHPLAGKTLIFEVKILGIQAGAKTGSPDPK